MTRCRTVLESKPAGLYLRFRFDAAPLVFRSRLLGLLGALSSSSNLGEGIGPNPGLGLEHRLPGVLELCEGVSRFSGVALRCLSAALFLCCPLFRFQGTSLHIRDSLLSRLAPASELLIADPERVAERFRGGELGAESNDFGGWAGVSREARGRGGNGKGSTWRGGVKRARCSRGAFGLSLPGVGVIGGRLALGWWICTQSVLRSRRVLASRLGAHGGRVR